tara:strand:+ start:2198 stop:3208 length:1011 start_codon:yes stop_codon:yes gene_type:complete
MNLLLIQLRRIGDVMMTTPAVRALRKAFPEASISFLTESPSDQVYKNNPHLDQLLLYPKNNSILDRLKFYRRIRSQNYDCVIDFQGNPRTALLSRISGSGYRIGFDFKGRSWCYHRAIGLPTDSKYSAQHKMNLLEPLGVESTDLELEMESSAEDQAYAEKLLKSVGSQAGKLQVSVSPVSRQPYKVWPAQHFAKLSDWLIESQGAQLYFLYGPGEEHFIESVKKEMNNDPMPDVGIPDLLQTRALLGKMDIHLGNDNGLRHLAIAAGIPTLGIFGKPSAVSWTPPGPTQHRSVEYDPGCKQSCTYPECEHLSCIRDVPVDEVHQALKKLLNDHVL